MAAVQSTTSLNSRQSAPAPRTNHSSVDPNDLEKLAASDQQKQQQPLLPGASPGHGGPEHQPDLFQPRSIKFWLTLLCNFLALFLVALDRTIIATAVPRITDEFKALGDIGWYGSAYMLTTACAQLVFGRIYKFYNMKW